MNRTMLTTIWVSVLLHLAAGLWFFDSLNFVAPEPEPQRVIETVVLPIPEPVIIEEPVKEPEPAQPVAVPRPVDVAVATDVPPLPLPPITGESNPDGPMTALDEAEPQPAIRVEPEYPERGIDRGKEGRVELLLTIMPDGSVADVRVVSVTPDGYGFDREALKAVRRWTYKPQLRSGVAVRRDNVRVEVIFKLED